MTGKPESIEQLRMAVERLYHCAAAHICTSDVREVMGGRTVWSGEVEIFRLERHPKARRCFAWFHGTSESGVITMLEIPPVSSPSLAVRSFLHL